MVAHCARDIAVETASADKRRILGHAVVLNLPRESLALDKKILARQDVILVWAPIYIPNSTPKPLQSFTAPIANQARTIVGRLHVALPDITLINRPLSPGA